jgi:hypothetical protein
MIIVMLLLTDMRYKQQRRGQKGGQKREAEARGVRVEERANDRRDVQAEQTRRVEAIAGAGAEAEQR